jgi:tRNA 2-thiouridine synthesizing protein A
MISIPNMPKGLGHPWRRVTHARPHIPVDLLKHAAYVRSMTHDLDATGLLCPLPVLKARKRLKALSPGDVLLLRTDDPAAVVDVPHFCAEAGHALEAQAEEGTTILWTIRRG